MCLNELSFHLFADDTNIFFESSNLDTLQTTVQEMGKLVNWLNSNRLALNVSKTNFVLFSAKNKPLNRQAFEQNDSVKYLGGINWLSFLSSI